MAPRTTPDDLEELDRLQQQIAQEERDVAAEAFAEGRAVRYSDGARVVLVETAEELATVQAVGVRGLLSGRRPRRSRRRRGW